MTDLLAIDVSPAAAVHRLRGEIVDAYPTHPDVLGLEIRDADAGIWSLTTLDATWWPTDPDALLGRRVVDGDIDGETGVLRLVLGDGGDFVVRPDPDAAPDDPPTWRLLTPNGLSLRFGPQQRWHVQRSDAPIAP